MVDKRRGNQQAKSRFCFSSSMALIKPNQVVKKSYGSSFQWLQSKIELSSTFYLSHERQSASFVSNVHFTLIWLKKAKITVNKKPWKRLVIFINHCQFTTFRISFDFYDVKRTRSFHGKSRHVTCHNINIKKGKVWRTYSHVTGNPDTMMCNGSEGPRNVKYAKAGKKKKKKRRRFTCVCWNFEEFERLCTVLNAVSLSQFQTQ